MPVNLRMMQVLDLNDELPTSEYVSLFDASNAATKRPPENPQAAPVATRALLVWKDWMTCGLGKAS